MPIKIERSWQSSDGNFTLGFDINGNLFAKCNECNKTAIGLLEYRNRKKSYRFRCEVCNKKLFIKM